MKTLEVKKADEHLGVKIFADGMELSDVVGLKIEYDAPNSFKPIAIISVGITEQLIIENPEVFLHTPQQSE